MERSCLQCKKAHRRCDRKKPCCSLCSERGKKCEYDTTTNLRFEPYKPPTSSIQHNQQQQNQQRTFHYVPQPMQYNNQISQQQQRIAPQPPMQTSPHSSPVQLPPLLPNNISASHVTTPPLPPSFTGIEVAAKQHTIDAIFEVQNMYSHMPLFPKARLQQIVKYVRATETKVPYDGPIPPSDELALVYSMQSQTFKIFGQCTISKRFHEKAYSLLFNYMDTALNNFVIIATFVHLAFPLICDAEIDRARFYLENVRTFISLRLYGQGQPQLEQRERFLKQLYFLATNNLLVGEAHKPEADATLDLTRVVKTFMYSHCLSRQHHLFKMREESRPEEEIRDWVSPVLYDDFAKYMNQIRDDLIMSTDKFHIDLARMEVIAKSFKEMFDSTQNGVAFVDVAIKRLQYVMVAQAARIQQLERAGRKQKALPIADYITELTNNPCYKYSTPIISVAVVVAANMHLEFGKMDMLKKDAAALAILRSRYEIVAKKYGPYIDMIEGVFRKFGEQEQVEDLSASLCSIKSGTRTQRMTPSPGQFASSPPQHVETYNSPEISVPTGVDQFLQVYLTDFETPDDSIFLSFNEM